MKLKLILTAAATVLLAGCVAPKMNTASGGPEVTINAPLAKVKAEVASAIVNAGYNLTHSDDLTIEGKKEGGMFLTAMTASPANPTSFKVTRANLIQVDGGVRVLLRCFLTAGGRDDGEITGARQQEQALLDKIKSKCEAK